MAKAVQSRVAALFFEIEEAPGHFAMDAAALEHTTIDHRSNYEDFGFLFRSDIYLTVANLVS